MKIIKPDSGRSLAKITREQATNKLGILAEQMVNTASIAGIQLHISTETADNRLRVFGHHNNDFARLILRYFGAHELAEESKEKELQAAAAGHLVRPEGSDPEPAGVHQAAEPPPAEVGGLPDDPGGDTSA